MNAENFENDGNDVDVDSTTMKMTTMMRIRNAYNCQFSVILLWWSVIVPLAVPSSMPGSEELFGEERTRILNFNIWNRSFIHGLFFSFNTITTIGLGNICVTSRIYLAVCCISIIVKSHFSFNSWSLAT